MDDEPKDLPKPRRRWKRWVLGFLLVLIAGLLWLNGPGARWIVESQLDKQLEAQKLSGTYEVQGSLASGLAIHDLALTGESIVQKVDSDLLKIDWSLSSLFKKQIEGLTLNRLHLVIDPKAPPLPPKEDATDADQEKAPDALEKTLELVRNLIKPASISLNDIHVEIRDLTSVSLASLSHEPHADTFVFRGFNGSDHLDRPVNNPVSTLTWTEKGFALDQLTVLPDLSIRDLTFDPGGDLATDIQLKDSKLGVTSNLTTDHAITLKSPTLQIQDAAWLYDPELPANGVITELQVDTATGRIKLEGHDLQWDQQKLASASIETTTGDITQPFGQPIDVKIALADQLDINGTVTLQKEILDSEAEFEFSLRDPRIPTITGQISYDAREARVLARALDGLQVNASYFVDSSTYKAQAISDLKDASVLEKSLAGPLKFSLTANGSIPDQTHQGKLDLTSVTLNKPGLPSATSQGEIQWNWPESVTIDRLQMDAPEGRLDAQLHWQDEILTINNISLTESAKKLLTATGKLPAPLKIPSLEEFLDSSAPIALSLKSQPLSFKTLSAFAPIPDTLKGVLQADLALAGSLAKPTLNGFTTLDDFRLSTQPTLPPASVRLNFKTENQKLLLTANAREPGGPLIDIKGELPFLPRAWIDRKKNPTESPIKLTATSPELNLKRVQPFVPMITSADGFLKLDFQAAGTLAKPTYSGTAKVRIKSMRLADSPISDFRNANLNLAVAGTTLTIQPSSLSASGGDVKLNGTVELGGDEPVFDISAQGSHFLLTRNNDYSFRGNPNLKLRGPLSSATVSGTVGLVESLFYKDVEILPFGVPRTTEVPSPNLPTFTRKSTPGPAAKKSGGVQNWKLDLDITTTDAILIRGNLARGEITGNVKVFGTIGNPKTSGSLSANKLSADLPFSDLQVQTAIVTLRPDSLTNPIINLRGTSNVGEYTVQVYLTGPVQNPNLLLTSNPPLPESEIMLLLATGSASAQLEDRQVASQKALQYLLEGIRRRNGDKDKTVLQRLLKNSDQIELSLGDTDQFSGRKFSSASLEISDQWDFTTQIDNQGQTRALVVFSIRFR
ncbi:translocation/assembly module TamB domain-containing protein [Verrucomicrobiaceae bacterium 227]